MHLHGHTHKEARREYSIMLHLIFLRLTISAKILASELQGSSYLHNPTQGITNTCTHTWLFKFYFTCISVQSQKKTSDTLELEVQMIISGPVGARNRL